MLTRARSVVDAGAGRAGWGWSPVVVALATGTADLPRDPCALVADRVSSFGLGVTAAAGPPPTST